MPKVDIDAIVPIIGVGYPPQFREQSAGRKRLKLGDAGGLEDFGVNLTSLPPGKWSAQRHWHRNEDEFIYVIEGEIVLCEDHSEIVLKPGDAAGFKANSGNGHCLINRTQKDAVYLEVGTRSVNETVVYSDIDMRLERDKTDGRYLKKTGEPYPPRKA